MYHGAEYKEVAKLWKVEFDTPKAAPKHKRYTRQQERDAAALERRLQTEGLNPTALQQTRDLIAEFLIAEFIRPVAAIQEQHSAKIEQQDQGLTAVGKSLEVHAQIMQQIAAGWTQHQYALPAPMYTAQGMPMMAGQPQTQQQPQVTQSPNSQSGQSHAQPQASDAMQSRAMNLTAAAQSNAQEHS